MFAYVQIESCDPTAQDPSYCSRGHYPTVHSPRLTTPAAVAAFTEAIVPVEAITRIGTISNDGPEYIKTVALATHNGRNYTIYTQTYPGTR